MPEDSLSGQKDRLRFKPDIWNTGLSNDLANFTLSLSLSLIVNHRLPLLLVGLCAGNYYMDYSHLTDNQNLISPRCY